MLKTILTVQGTRDCRGTTQNQKKTSKVALSIIHYKGTRVWAEVQIKSWQKGEDRLRRYSGNEVVKSGNWV